MTPVLRDGRKIQGQVGDGQAAKRLSDYKMLFWRSGRSQRVFGAPELSG